MTAKLKCESIPPVETVSAETTSTEEQVRASRQLDELLATAQNFLSEELTSEH